MALTSSEQERLSVIRGAIEEIANRPDLCEAAKERGVRALRRAEARLLSAAGARAACQPGRQSAATP